MRAKMIGSGWHKQSLRHSNARRLGRAGGTYSKYKIYVENPRTKLKQYWGTTTEKGRRAFKDEELIKKVYFGANEARVGGYSFKTTTIGTTRISGSADFVSWEDLVRRAESQGIKWVYLAGDWQRNPELAKYNHKGMGERVLLSVVKKIMRQDPNIQLRSGYYKNTEVKK